MLLGVGVLGLSCKDSGLPAHNKKGLHELESIIPTLGFKVDLERPAIEPFKPSDDQQILPRNE